MRLGRGRARALLVIFLLVVAVPLTASVIVPSPVKGAVPSGPNPPLGVHLSYLDDPTTATITWHTAVATASRAEWGPSIGPPYASHASGTDYASPGGTHLHVVNLMGLTPGAQHYYRVGDDTMSSYFGQASFRAAPPKGASETFTFAAAGDWGNTGQTASVSNAIAKRNPNFVLPLGDLYYSDNEANVRGVYEKWMTFGQGSFLQPGMGNHEVDEGGSGNTPTAVHCAFSNLIGNERTYAFTWGNTFFVTIDWGGSTTSQLDGVDGALQNCNGVAGTPAIRAWVDARLAAANSDPTIRWTVVYQHFLCYDTTDTGFPLLCSTDGGNDQIEDILTSRQVDLVLTAHDHTYGRTHPVAFQDVAQTGTAYNTPGAPIYFVLGTGGASGTATCRSATWIADCHAAPPPAKGFGWFQVSPTMIRYEFLNISAGMKIDDSFTLTKSPSAGLAVSADPSALHVQPGDAVSTNVTVLGASVDPVALNRTGCPPDATCQFLPAIGIPPFTSALSVTTATSTPEGMFRITVTASNLSTSATAPFDITVAKQITRTYQQGDGGPYSGTEDAYIYNGSVNGNFGSAPTLRVDDEDCQIDNSAFVCRTLIKFPQLVGPNEGQVPPGARILSATVQLNITNKGGSEDLYQVIEGWAESTVTWNSFTTPGFPRKVEPAFTFLPSALGWISVNVTYVVQKWAEGDPNEGFLLTSTSGDGVIYHSSESSSSINRPKLTVTYENATVPGGPVLSYDMENLTTDGRMQDLSGNGRHGTMTGTTDVPGKVGRARHFNGAERITASAISVPATDFTVAAWFNWTTNPSPYYGGIQGGGCCSWELRVQNDGRFAVIFYQTIAPDVYTAVSSPLTYNDGTWHHAAGLLRNGLAELYVDGVLVAQATTGSIASVRTSTLTEIGRVASYFVGDIDEVRVFSRALSAEEIGALVPPLPPSVDGLVLSYDMQNLTAGGWMKDLSGQGHHGTLTGTADVAGKIGRARHFSGGERITASAISLPALNFTVAAWFNWTTNPSPFYSGIHGGGCCSWELRVIADGRFAVVFYQSIGPDVLTEVASPLVYNDGTWHHAAGVLRSGLAELYVDGLLVAQATTNPIASVRTSTLTEIGRVASYFVGDIDEVRVFIRALTAAEIGALAPPPPARTDGLVLSYDMETLLPGGQMKDLSGQGHHGTLTGTADVAGKIGRARHFSGGDRITASPASVPTLNFTVAAWFNWTTNPSPYYGGIQGGGCCSWELRVQNDGRFAVIFYQTIAPDVYTAVSSPLTYNDGTWHHAAGLLRNGLAELYVDGVLVAQATTGSIASVRTSTLTEIGRVASYFVGDIDEVRVFSRALSAEEIGAVASGSASSVQHANPSLHTQRAIFVVGDDGDCCEDTENSIHTTIRRDWIGPTWFTGGIFELTIGSVFAAIAFYAVPAKSRVRTGGVLGRWMRGRRP